MPVPPRVVAVWLLLVVAVLNFAPALFTPTPLEEWPNWSRLLKDLPVVALFAMAVLTPQVAAPPRALRRPIRALLIAIAVLAVTMVADYAARNTPASGFVASMRYYVAYPATAFAVYRLRLSREEINRVLAGLVILGAAESAVALLDFLHVIGHTYYTVPVGHSHSRAIGTLGNPNNLGLFLGLPALLAIAGDVVHGRLRWIALALIAAGMVASLSKAVAIAIGVAVVFQTAPRWLARREGWARRRLVLGIIAASVAAFAVVLVLRQPAGIHLQPGGVDLSPSGLVGTRVVTTPESLDRWTARPSTFLLGEGFGSQTVSNPAGGVLANVTDNMALTLGLEGGLLGLVLFSLMVAAGMWVAARCYRMAQTSLTRTLLASLIFFLLYSPITMNFRMFPGALMFWATIGLMVSLAAAAHARGSTRGRLPPVERKPVPAGIRTAR